MSYFRKVQQQSLLDLIPRVDTLWNVDAIAKCLELIIDKFNISSFNNLLDHSLVDFNSVFLSMQILSNARMFKSDFKDKFMEFLLEPYAKSVFDIVRNSDLFIMRPVKKRVAHQTNGVKKRRTSADSDKDEAIAVDFEKMQNKTVTAAIDSADENDTFTANSEQLLPIPPAKSSKEELLDRLLSNDREKRESTERVQMLFSSDLESDSSDPSMNVRETSLHPPVAVSDLIQIFNTHTTRTHEEMVEHLRDTKATLKGLLSNTMRQICNQIDASFENTKHLLKSPNALINTKDTHMTVLGSIYQELESKMTPQFISQEFSNLFSELQYSMADADGKSKLGTLPQPYKRIIEHQINKL